MSNLFSEKVPLSYQLAQFIRQKIIAGEYPVGSRITPEVQLARDHGVSVITVQRALRTLENERLIRRQRGKGTFVSELPKHLAMPTSHLALDLMFSDEFEDAKLLERSIVPVPTHLAAHFPDIEEVAMYRRLVFQEGRPWSYAVHHLRPEYAEQFDDELLCRFPAFRLLREKLDLKLKNVEIRLQAQLPTPQIANLLESEPVDPILLFTGALYGTDARVVDVPQIWFRGDRFTFSFDMDLTPRPTSG